MSSRDPQTATVAPAIIVHGGAFHWPEAHRAAARAGCLRAAQRGLQTLASGGAALDAVVAAVRDLESNPRFNAGTGAVLTRARTFELDASLMNGADRSFGGVAAMNNIAHPIDVARAVLEDGEHTLLCADGAWQFARERGFAPCTFDELATEHALQQLAKVAAERELATGRGPVDPGTVGACAIDASGHVAAATSTGGMTFKRPGRIGDTPLCGAGTYADDRGGAASATGEGEAITRALLSHRCVLALRASRPAWEAAWEAIDILGNDVPGSVGGIICVDAQGRLGAAHSTPGMPIAAATLGPDGEVANARVVSERGDASVW